tara:strand:+ start:162 stop:1997 length:1836 start_codon:yes stop_codon:yes gene_type:complete
MSIQQVLAVIKQGNSASFPNQQAQRVFTNLRRNPRNSMEQINKAASLADQYLQNQIAGNKEFLKGQNIPTMKAPPVDGGVNIASSQIAGKVPPDQAELVATGQGSVLQKRDLQNAGISSGGSSTNNLSSTNIATNETSAQRFLQAERDEISSQLGEQGLPITPTRIEAELANRLGTDAYSYGPKYTRRKHALQAGASYEPKLFNRLRVPSVQIAGQSVPYTPTQGSGFSIRKPTITENTALNLKSEVDKQKTFLGKVRLEATSIMRGLEKQAKPIKQAQMQARNRRDFATVDRLETELVKLRGTYQKQQRRIARAEDKVTENISNLGLPLKLTEGIESGQRIYAEVDPTRGKGGKVRTTTMDSAGVADDLADDIATDFDISGTPVYKEGTVEIRPERIAINTPAKGGGGRNIANYTGSGSVDEKVRSIPTGGLIQESPQRVRRTQGRYRDYDAGTDELNQGGGAPQPPYQDDSALTGNVTDIYGTRGVSIDSKTDRDILKDNPEKRPTAVSASKTPLVQKATPEGKQSFAISSKEREIRTDQSKPLQQRAVDAQTFVREQIKQITGASAVGSFTPLAQKPLGTYKAPTKDSEYLRPAGSPFRSPFSIKQRG